MLGLIAAGSVIYFGSMDSTYWNEDDVLQRRFYDGMFRDGRRQFSEIADYGMKEVWRHYGGAGSSKYYYETYVTFGDPLTRVRTAPTRSLLVEGPVRVMGGSRPLDYRIFDKSGQPIAGARVAVVSRGTDYAIAGTTGADGKLGIVMTDGPPHGGLFDVTVSADNAKLWRGTLELF